MYKPGAIYPAGPTYIKPDIDKETILAMIELAKTLETLKDDTARKVLIQTASLVNTYVMTTMEGLNV